MTVDTSRAYLDLHHLLQQLHDTEYLLEHGPKRIAASQKKMAAARQACEDQKELIQSLRKASDQSSLNLKTREAEIEKLNGRLNQATSNKEYDIIQAQIASQKAADAELEDNILSLLSKVDEATDELKNRETELIQAEENSRQIADEVQSKEPGLRAESDRLKAEIAEAEKAIPGGEARAAYQRLRAAQGPSALARADDGFCTECNTATTPQDVVHLNMGEFVLCRACGRILYQVTDDAD